MNKSIIMLGGIALALVGCDENAWNDKLEGFDGESTFTEVKNISYTLTNSDYGTIAGLASNVALAGETDAEWLAAFKKSRSFNDVITADKYLPAFLSSTQFPYFTLDDGSTVKVKYNQEQEMPEVLAQLKKAKYVVVSESDYISAWDSDDDYVQSYTYAVPPSKYVPRVLANANIDTENVQYAVVSYNYSSQEPVFEVKIPEDYHSYIPTDEIISGENYLLVADNIAALTLEEKNYGYLGALELSIDNVGVEGVVKNGAALFTITATDGGFYIQDCLGRYLYMTGTYNSFNFSASVVDGCIWTIDFVEDGVKIINKDMDKWIQYDPNYSSFGSYPDQRGVNPVLYMANPSAPEIPVVSVPSEKVYALYKYNGSAWKEDNTAIVLQHSDYEKMGLSGDYFASADAGKYLPIYMQLHYPYAVKNDTKDVVYFTTSKGEVFANQMNYDGSNWTVYNGIVSKVTKFEKKNGKWSVAPGLAEFTHSRVTELVSGGRYLIVTNNQAAVMLSASYAYGYLQVVTVDTDEENVNLPDAEDCEFILTQEGDGWTITDRLGRYYYQTGTYNSFNVSTEMSDNSKDGFYWNIEFDEDGNASITNTVVNKTIQYATDYKSYGSYATINFPLPALYQAVE